MSVEKILLGESNGRIAQEMISNAGMDALIRYQSFSVLTKEHFNMCITPVLKSANLLDLLGAPVLNDFSEDKVTCMERIEEIIALAESIYDNVVILFDGEHKESASVINAIIDKHEYKEVISLQQGQRYVPEKGYAGSNRYYIIHEYDEDSLFSLKYYRKLLDTDNVCMLPYNITFKDAYLSGNLLMFLRKNINNDSAGKEGNNAMFVQRAMEFVQKITGKKEKSDSLEDAVWLHKSTVRTGNVRRVVTEENVLVKECGILKKQRVVTLQLSEPEKWQSELHITNYMYKTKRKTFDRLLKMADEHKRSINDELDYIVKNYIFYYETSKAVEEKNRQRKAAATTVRKAFIS